MYEKKFPYFIYFSKDLEPIKEEALYRIKRLETDYLKLKDGRVKVEEAEFTYLRDGRILTKYSSSFLD